jgi:hypothetical protein
MRKRNYGLKTGNRKRIGVSNMITEEKKGLKYGYGNEVGSNMVMEANWNFKNAYGRNFLVAILFVSLSIF